MTYKILTRNQSTQVLVEIVNGNHVERGIIVNGIKGWEAYRTQPCDGGRNEPIGQPISVSRMVNQHGGGSQIAAALGLVG